MDIKIEKDRTVIKQKKSNKKWIALVILLIIAAAAGMAGYRAYTAETFPKGTLVNGVDVGGLTAEEARSAILKGMNTIEVKMDDNDPVKVKTSYEYEVSDTLKDKVRLASVDPRQLWEQLSYSVPLTISDGVDKTAKVLKKKLPIDDDVVVTKDAYINYDEMVIEKEVYGDSLDYTKIAEDIASQRQETPKKTEFEFKKDDYIAKPKVVVADLQDELSFAKHYIKDGMKMDVEGAGVWEITPTQLSKVILYTEDGPEYSEEGATKVAKQISKEFHRDFITVRTKYGDKRLINYVLEDEVDVEKTAASILDAAKNGGKATVCLSKNSIDQIKTRVEISISKQKVFYIENDKVKFKSSVVTGSSANPTPVGIFTLYYKERNVTLKGDNGDGTEYASPVSFWMPFNGGIGLHDAPWRSSFGGNIYVNSGSHGCVNMPYDKAAALYKLIDAGTVVIVYE